MKKNRHLWRLLFDLNMFCTGAVAMKWYMLGNNYFLLYSIPAALLMLIGQLEASIENKYIRALLKR